MEGTITGQDRSKKAKPAPYHVVLGSQLEVTYKFVARLAVLSICSGTKY